MRNILNTSPQVGDSIYRSPVDFTSAYLGANTLTLAGMPYVPVDNQFVTTIVTTAAGAVVQYPAASYYHSLVAGVLTVAGANFLATDLSYVVVVNGPVRGYNAVGDYFRFGEVDSLDQHADLVNLIDTTNLNVVSNLPSDAGLDTLGRHHFVLTGKLIEANAGPPPEVIKIQVYGTNDEDIVPANRDWVPLVGYRDDNASDVNAICCSLSTVTFGWRFTNCRYKYIRVTCSPDMVGATFTNTFIVKLFITAL